MRGKCRSTISESLQQRAFRFCLNALRVEFASSLAIWVNEVVPIRWTTGGCQDFTCKTDRHCGPLYLDRISLRRTPSCECSVLLSVHFIVSRANSTRLRLRQIQETGHAEARSKKMNGTRATDKSGMRPSRVAFAIVPRDSTKVPLGPERRYVTMVGSTLP